MTRQENITKMHELALDFIRQRNAVELKQTVQKIVTLANSFKYSTSGKVYPILIPTYANNLLANIQGIVDGSIDPEVDQEIQDALVIFENIAESSIDN